MCNDAVTKARLTLSRRTLMQASLTVAGASLVPVPWMRRRAFADAAPPDEPHFLLFAVMAGGLDCTYLFDARPLAMTKANLQSNYLGAEPDLWSGANGQTTYATKLTAPLKPYQGDFSVINGVVMAASFDGHGQNMDYLLTGDPFGGESLVPHLNTGNAPLDYVAAGDPLFADVTNDGASIPLSATATKQLVDKLNAGPGLGDNASLFGFMKSRMAAVGAGPGRFSAAARAMGTAAGRAPALEKILRGMAIKDTDLAQALEFFKAGVTPSAVLNLQPQTAGNQFLTLDMHSPSDAQNAGNIIGSVGTQIANLFATLKNTPYDGKRSMLDVTTVIATTEFSRTMRHPGLAIDQTGTDHNPLNNSVIIGGKGIKGGLVLGESDRRTPDETISGAHKSVDSDDLKLMGKPFDFAAGRPRGDLPASYQASDYLLFASVANTLYTAFGANKEHFWLTERNGNVAPVLTTLLA